MWEKTTLFDYSTRIPLMVYADGVTTTRKREKFTSINPTRMDTKGKKSLEIVKSKPQKNPRMERKGDIMGKQTKCWHHDTLVDATKHIKSKPGKNNFIMCYVDLGRPYSVTISKILYFEWMTIWFIAQHWVTYYKYLLVFISCLMVPS